MLLNNVGYLSLGAIKHAELPETMAKLKNTKGLVNDIRNYPAEFVVFSLTKYLLAKPVPFVRFSEPQPTCPGIFCALQCWRCRAPRKRSTRAKSLFW